MQRLELTWIGKGKELQVEPRILLNDSSKNYGDSTSENMLIHGDNLLALNALEQDFAGKVKCIFIDPPFNTGAAFEHYDDNLEHSIWLDLMYRRLKIMRTLLMDDGAIYINLDDSEAAYAKVLMDEIFGRSNYLNEIIVATNKSFGFKSTSDGIFKQANHVLFYAKNKFAFQINVDAMFIEKEYDEQYKWVFENCDDIEERWTWRSIKEIVAEKLGFSSAREAAKKDAKSFAEQISVFALENADRVFRTASVTGGALLKRKDTITLSRKNRDKIIRHPNDDMDYMFIGGERVIYYKERLKELDGVMLPAEVITDIWSDISIEGLAKEGGVTFPRGKKPEKLLQRCIELSTKKGDIVLDSFLGSGTTAAVAHKMGRRYIGIELGDHCYTHCLPRLKGVVDGEQSGISKAVDWKGGGGFKFYELAPTLIVKDSHGQPVLNDEFNFNMLVAAVAKLNGFIYSPNSDVFWKQGYSQDNSYIYITTQYLTTAQLDNIATELSEYEKLLICAPAFDIGIGNRYENIDVRKIPESLISKFEYSVVGYDFNFENSSKSDEEELADVE